MVDIHIIFDGTSFLSTINLILVLLVVIITLQVINNFIGSYHPIFKPKEKKIETKIEPKKKEPLPTKKKSTAKKDKFSKVPKIIKDDLVDEKNKKGILGFMRR